MIVVRPRQPSAPLRLGDLAGQEAAGRSGGLFSARGFAVRFSTFFARSRLRAFRPFFDQPVGRGGRRARRSCAPHAPAGRDPRARVGRGEQVVRSTPRALSPVVDPRARSQQVRLGPPIRSSKLADMPILAPMYFAQTCCPHEKKSLNERFSGCLEAPFASSGPALAKCPPTGVQVQAPHHDAAGRDSAGRREARLPLGAPSQRGEP